MRRMRLAIVLVTLALVALAPDSFAQGEDVPGERPLVDSLESCLRAEQSLSVLFMIDESGSLAPPNGTDPEGHRATGAQAALAVASLWAVDPPPGFEPIDMRVMIAGFGTEFTDYSGGFRPITQATLPSLGAELAEFADRYGAQNTDYVRGLLGAISNLESQDTCRLLIWVTDGRYDIMTSEPRPDYDAAAGGRPGGPLADAYEEIGRDWLCSGPGSIGDLLRDGDIHMLTVALALEPPSERLFTQRITEASDDEGAVCGTRIGDGRRLGSFVNAARAIDLISDIDPWCSDCPVIRGTREFQLVSPMAEVWVVAIAETADYRVGLISPEAGDREIVYPEPSFRLGSVEVGTTWLSERVFILALRPGRQTGPWEGIWTLWWEPADQGLSKISFFGDLTVTPVTGVVEAVAGGTIEVSFRVLDRGEELPEPDLVRAIRARITVGYPDGPAAQDLEGVGPSLYRASVTIPAGTPEGDLEVLPFVSIEVPEIPEAAEQMTFDGAPVIIRVVAPPPPTTTTTTTTTTIPPPPGAPGVTAGFVELPELRGAGTTRADDAIAVEGSATDGCVLLAGVEFSELPDGLEPPAVAVTSDGAPLPSVGPSCADVLSAGGPGAVPAETAQGLSVEATTTEQAEGRVAGTIRLRSVDGTGVTETLHEVGFGFDVERERAPGMIAFWWLLFALGGLGLAAGIRFLWLGGRPRPVFQPDPNHVHFASRGVRIPSGGAVVWQPPLGWEGLTYLAVGGGSQPVSTLAVEAGRAGLGSDLVLEAAGDGGLASCGEKAIATSADTERLPLHLDAVWILVVDEVDGDPASGAVTGTVVVFHDARAESEALAAVQLEAPLRTAAQALLAGRRSAEEKSPGVDIRKFYDDET